MKVFGFLLVLFQAVLLLAATFAFYAAYSESNFQCPDGNDCYDSITAMKVFGTAIVVLLVTTAWSIKELGKMKD